MVLLIIFLVGIALPFAGQLSGISQPVSENIENRRAAAFPEMQFREHGPILWPRKQSLVEFPEKFEAYYNDHLGFRREMVRCYNLARLYGVAPEMLASPGMGEKQGSPVLVGRDGWLYFNRQGSLETFRCAKLFSQADLDQWETVLRQRRDWLAAKGIHYVVIVAPEKPTIYPEFLPRSLHRVGKVSRLDQLLEHVQKRASGINVVDVRGPLLEAKDTYPTYFRTDTHWNSFGAYIAYQHLMQAISAGVPGVAPAWPLADFDIELQQIPGMDLARMLDSLMPPGDVNVAFTPRRPRETVRKTRPPVAGSRACARTTNAAAPPVHAFVLHDSFYIGMMPFFEEHWRQVDYYWMYDFPHQAIDRERPQVVVQELVERSLTLYGPENPPELMATP